MACRRCGGLMVVELLYDPQEEASRMHCRGSRCVNCGCIDDPVIRANRTQPPALGRPAARGSVAGRRILFLP
ncbi:MAG: hypothetical protein AB1555_06005 [Nitrospirota bacterium]